MLSARALLEREPRARRARRSARRCPATCAAAPATRRSSRRSSSRREPSAAGARLSEPSGPARLRPSDGAEWARATCTAAARPGASFRVVGRAQRKVDGLAKATGQAVYTDDIVAAGHAAREDPAQPARARAHQARSTRRAALALPGRARRDHRAGPADQVRHHPLDARRERAGRRQGALRRRRGRRGGGRRRGHGQRGARADRGRVRAAARLPRPRRGAAPRRAGDPRAIPSTRRATSRSTSRSSSATSRPRWPRRDVVVEERLLLRRHDPHADRAALRGRRSYSADGAAHACGRRRRSRTTCTATLARVLELPPQRDPRDPAVPGRRVRRQERAVLPRVLRRQARACSPAGR